MQFGEQEAGNFDALASAAAVKLKIIYRLRSFNDFDVLASSATVKRKEKLWVPFFGSFCSCICCCEAEENLCASYFGDFGVLASAATVKLEKIVGFVLLWRFDVLASAAAVKFKKNSWAPFLWRFCTNIRFS